jgi:small basic protein (TIGR04137 family)
MHQSLRRKSRLARQRSVLSRGERIAQMKTDEKWTDSRSPFGLPKTRIAKQTVGKKKKKEKKEGEEGEAATGAAAPVAAGKGAPAAKGAAAGKAAPGKK